MSNWNIKGVGARAFSAPTVAELLREMADFADEWTEDGESEDRFVSDVTIRYGEEEGGGYEGVLYTDDTSHLDDLLRVVRDAVSTGVGQNDASRAAAPAPELPAISVILGRDGESVVVEGASNWSVDDVYNRLNVRDEGGEVVASFRDWIAVGHI